MPEPPTLVLLLLSHCYSIPLFCMHALCAVFVTAAAVPSVDDSVFLIVLTGRKRLCVRVQRGEGRIYVRC